ncbi:hypothetical protein [Paraburkholderia sp. JPY419]|uniref:hypothetical protein n=1 Tax=Paraburkholderia sp. JPY419 TaxID=667660 RepID=UPI003D1B6535
MTDPTHEEHDHFLEWCGGSFDPAAFDLVLTNQRLSEVSSSDRQDGLRLTLTDRLTDRATAARASAAPKTL